jgi:hypothetical protein
LSKVLKDLKLVSQIITNPARDGANTLSRVKLFA